MDLETNSDIEDDFETNIDLKSFVNENENIEYFKSRGTSIYGLNDWISQEVDIIGNVGKCSYDNDGELFDEWKLIVEKFPEIDLKIHLGDNNQEKRCVSTIIVKNGIAEIIDPEIKKIKEDHFRASLNLTMMLSRNK